jgi:hypothetical protein
MLKKLSLGFMALAFFASINAFAAGKTYQVTGPVLEVTDSTITVQKATEKWEIQKDASTKVTGDLKVGSKVTIEYIMTAKNVEVKADKPAAGAKTTDTKAPAKPAATKASDTKAKTK